VLPLVAGMLDMPAQRFFSVNLLSAFAWAPAYLLPGMAFGASLAIAGEVAGRLALLLALLLVSGWLLIWSVHGLYRWLQPHAQDWGFRLWQRSQQGTLAAWLLKGLFDAERRASSALLVWLLILLGGSWLFLGVLEDVLTDDPLVSAGYGLYQLMQDLRTPLADHIMVAISALGDSTTIITVVVAVLLNQLWRRHWHEALYWLASLGFAIAAIAVLKAGLHVPRPIDLYSGVETFAFPSGHVTLSIVVYGYLAMLIAAGLPLAWRWLSYACATLLISAIAFSRLYLGAHWLADVAAGIGLGMASVAVLAIARHYHLQEFLSPQQQRQTSIGVLLVTVVSFIAAASWHIPDSMDRDLQRYAIRHHAQTLAQQQWWDTDWRQEPAYRIDTRGVRKQPLNIQWAGDLSELQQQLVAQGWQVPRAVTAKTAMQWFSPQPKLQALPVLPQMHNGHRDALRLVLHRPQRHWVLRLWLSNQRLQPGDTPLWLGTVTNLRLQCLPLLCFPRAGSDYDEALAVLTAMTRERTQRPVQRQIVDAADAALWQGKVLLLR
jgi:undecaprenyl-diphosphatase